MPRALFILILIAFGWPLASAVELPPLPPTTYLKPPNITQGAGARKLLVVPPAKTLTNTFRARLPANCQTNLYSWWLESAPTVRGPWATVGRSTNSFTLGIAKTAAPMFYRWKGTR